MSELSLPCDSGLAGWEDCTEGVVNLAMGVILVMVVVVILMSILVMVERVFRLIPMMCPKA